MKHWMWPIEKETAFNWVHSMLRLVKTAEYENFSFTSNWIRRGQCSAICKNSGGSPHFCIGYRCRWRFAHYLLFLWVSSQCKLSGREKLNFNSNGFWGEMRKRKLKSAECDAQPSQPTKPDGWHTFFSFQTTYWHTLTTFFSRSGFNRGTAFFSPLLPFVVLKIRLHYILATLFTAESRRSSRFVRVRSVLNRTPHRFIYMAVRSVTQENEKETEKRRSKRTEWRRKLFETWK